MATYSAGEASIRITSSLQGFAADLRRKLEQVQATFAVDVEGDLTRLRRDLAAFRETVTVDVRGDFTTLRAQLAALDGQQITVNANADTAFAEAQIAALTRDRTVNVDVNVNGGGIGSLASNVGRIGSSASAGSSSLAGMGSTLSSLAGATAGIMGVASAIAAIGGAAGVAGGAVGALGIGLSTVGAAGAAGIGTLVVGLSGVGDAFSAIGKQSSGAGAAAEDSARAVTSAQNALTTAVKNEKRAQDDVARARKNALEKLEDLNLELRGGALSERDAVLSLKEAQRDLATGKFDDPLDRERATLRVAEAQQRLLEVQESNGDLEERAADARQKGVDRADEVVAANDRLAESQQRVTEAQLALADAQKPAAGGGGVDKAAEALAKLSPNAREFVLAMTALKPAWEALQNSVQDKMFEGLGATFTDLANSIFPTLQSGMGLVATSINGAAKEFAAFWSTASAQEGLQAVFAGTADLITAVQPGLAAMTQGFLTMMQSAAPAMAEIGAGLGLIFGQIGTALGEVDTSFFDSFAVLLGSVGVLLGDLVRMLTELGTQVMPALSPFLVAFGDALVAMSGPVGALGAALLDGLTPVLPVLAELINAMADGLAPILPILSQALQTVGNALIESLPIAAPVIQQLVGLFGQLLTAVAPILPPLIQLTAAILTPLIGIVQQIVAALAPFITQLMSQLTPIITALTPILAEVGRLIGDAMVSALQTLLPIMGPFVQSLLSLMQAMLPMIPAWVQLATQLLPLTLNGIRVLMPVLTILIQAFSEWAQLVMPLVVGALTAVSAVIGVVGAAVNGLLGVWTTVMNGIRDGATGARDWVTGRFDELVNMITGMPARITTAASNMFEGIKEAFRGALNWIIKAWNDFKIEMKIPDKIPMIGGRGFTVETPDLAFLASGGSVSGPGGPRDDMVPAMLSNGEFVVNAASTAAHLPLLRAINDGVPHLADGGQIVNGSEITTSVQQTMWDAVRNEFPDATLNSGTRYADVGSGYDYHMQGMALDLGGPMGDIARWIYGLNATQPVTELIHAPLDGWENLKDGAPLNYGAGTDSQHYDHVHWAMTSFSGATPAPPAPVDGNPYVPTPGQDQMPGWETDPSGGASGFTSPGATSSPTTWSGFAGDFGQKAGTILAKGALDFFGINDEIPPIVAGVQEYNQFRAGQNQPQYSEPPVSTVGVDNSGNTGTPPPAASPSPSTPPPPTYGGTTPQDGVKRAFQPLGWDTGPQWDAADWIIDHESSWNPLARNPSSGAFGLFQFLGTTKDQYLPDENPDPEVQGKAGGRYIGDRYVDPLGAKAAWEAQGWYADGGYVSGPGGPRSDSIPAYLSNGEFVVNAQATRQNMPILEAINSGQQVSKAVDRSVHFHGGINALDARDAMREADRKFSLATLGVMGALP